MKKNRITRTLALMLSLVLTAASLSGCGGSESSDAGDTINIAIMRSGFTLPLYYASENGLFEEAGLNVEVQYYDNGPQVNEAIASGAVDVAGIGQMPSVTGGIANKSKVVAWMEDDEASVQAYARDDSDIVAEGKGHVEGHPDIYGTAETWKGKKIICAKGTSSHFGLLATLSALGLTDSDVTIVDMEGSKGATTFASGEGDIFFGFDPQWSEFYSNTDDYTLISTCKSAGQSLYTVLIASDAFCNERSEDLTALLKVMLEVEETFRNDPDKYAEEMYNWQAFYGNSTEELAAYSAELKPYRTLDEQKAMFSSDNGSSEVDKSYEKVIDFMIANHVISEEDASAFYDNETINPSFMFDAIDRIQG